MCCHRLWSSPVSGQEKPKNDGPLPSFILDMIAVMIEEGMKLNAEPATRNGWTKERTRLMVMTRYEGIALSKDQNVSRNVPGSRLTNRPPASLQ